MDSANRSLKVSVESRMMRVLSDPLSGGLKYAEFGYFSETELKLPGNRVSRVLQKNWSVCPKVEVQETHEHGGNHGAHGGCGCASHGAGCLRGQ